MSHPGVFLAGTDTGVGKTALGCALLRLALRRGLRPVPLKPVETGANPDPADAMRLHAAASHPTLTLAQVCPLRFAAPVAPAQAAEQAGTPLSLPALAGLLPPAAARGDFLLVESAGGLLTPYAPEFTGADLAAASGLPVLLVARNALGTINHTALAVSELRRRRLPIAGIVLMEVSSDATPDRPRNAFFIEAVTGLRPLAALPYLENASPDRLADALAGQIPPAELFARFGA